MLVKRTDIPSSEVPVYEQAARDVSASTSEQYSVTVIASEKERYFPYGPGTEGKRVPAGNVAIRISYPHHRGVQIFTGKVNELRTSLVS